MCVAFNPPYIKHMPRIQCHTVFVLHPLCLFVMSVCAQSSGRLIHPAMPSQLYLCFSSGFGRVFRIVFWCKVSLYFLSLFVLWGNNFCRLQYIMTIRRESVWVYPYHSSVSLTLLIMFLLPFRLHSILRGQLFTLGLWTTRPILSFFACKRVFHVLFNLYQQWSIKPVLSALHLSFLFCQGTLQHVNYS